jgi:hypothetical protein
MDATVGQDATVAASVSGSARARRAMKIRHGKISGLHLCRRRWDGERDTSPLTEEAN